MVVLAAIIGILAATTPAVASPHNTDTGSYYNGVVFQGSSLRVGLNDYGVLGVYNTSLGAVGFQYPVGSSYESLATGWWGDGWSIFYGSSSAGFSPSDDAWGTISGVTPQVAYARGIDGATLTSTIETSDGALRITTKIHVWNTREYVVADIVITNIGSTTLSNVEFKKIVDWDVWEPYTGSYDDYWGIDSRMPQLHLTVAFLNTSIAPGTVYMGFASTPGPNAIDLYWDDYTSRGISSPTVVYLDSNGASPSAPFDGAVVYDWILGDMAPGESRTIRVVYAAGNNLGELETNIADALSATVGGSLVTSGRNVTSLIYMAPITMLAILAAALYARRFKA